jgi:hypothetical protein
VIFEAFLVWTGLGLNWFWFELVLVWTGSGLNWFWFELVLVWTGSGLNWFWFEFVVVWIGFGSNRFFKESVNYNLSNISTLFLVWLEHFWIFTNQAPLFKLIRFWGSSNCVMSYDLLQKRPLHVFVVCHYTLRELIHKKDISYSNLINTTLQTLNGFLLHRTESSAVCISTGFVVFVSPSTATEHSPFFVRCSFTHSCRA